MKNWNWDVSPIILAVEMGYGHLRPAYALAEAFKTEVTRMDAPPIAGSIEAAIWKAVRTAYHGLSRACDWPGLGPAAKRMLGYVTRIEALQSLSPGQPANLSTHLADGLAGRVIGKRFRDIASWAGKPVIATYPVAAFAARCVPGARIFCLVTDTDLNRAWAPVNTAEAEIVYFAPVEQVAKRLRSFGVPDHKIHITGFPLPPELVGGADAALARRLRQLDPNSNLRQPEFHDPPAVNKRPGARSSGRPISLAFAIGGAGAQTSQVAKILNSLQSKVLNGDLKLTLIAGIRPKVASILFEMVRCVGLGCCIGRGIHILLAKDLDDYFHTFNECLADTDVLWTKPSELVFYASLGLPLLLADPVGGQEHANRKWLLSVEGGLDAGDPTQFDGRIANLLDTGELCRIAQNAYSKLKRNGSDRIIEVMDEYASSVSLCNVTRN